MQSEATCSSWSDGLPVRIAIFFAGLIFLSRLDIMVAAFPQNNLLRQGAPISDVCFNTVITACSNVRGDTQEMGMRSVLLQRRTDPILLSDRSTHNATGP